MQALGVMPRYYAQAQRYLYDRGRLEMATDDQLASLAESLRYDDFRRHVEPYLQQKMRLVSDFLALQATPNAKMPKELEVVLAQWDEMTAIEAGKFGYASNIPTVTE
jgi:hypothetical protein